jgi:hypothetical protein
MPVIVECLKDPTDIVLMGEQLRDSCTLMPVVMGYWPMLAGACEEPDTTVTVMGAQELTPMNVWGWARNIRLNPFACTLVQNNAVICTPCGAIVLAPYGQRIMDTYVEAAVRFALTGVTKDSAGAALGNCRVVVLDAGQLANNASRPFVAEGYSDGAGNYSIEVPQNTALQAIAYKQGSPDVAGITRSDVTPTHYA